MMDVMYVVISIAFFALMLAYARGCEAVAQRSDSDSDPRP